MCRAENNLQADNYWGGGGLGMVGGGGGGTEAHKP